MKDNVLISIITVLASAEPINCAIITLGLVVCYAIGRMQKNTD